MCAWSANVAFLIHCKSTPSPPHLFKGSSTNLPGFVLYRYLRREYFPPPAFGFQGLSSECLQVLSTWASEQSVCVVLNTESGIKNIIVTLVSDVVLLLTMLVGLLRLRRHGTVFALGQLLWKQVGNAASCSHCLLIFSCKGLVWLFAATVAEVPPSVSPIAPPLISLSLIHTCSSCRCLSV